MKHNYRYLNYVGDSAFDNRFATRQEMEANLTRLDISEPSAVLPKAGMPFLTDTKTVYADTQDYHTLILGSTGSMKTRTLILPTILTLAMAEENIVIADPKGELYDKVSGYLASRGYVLNVLNLRDMEHSDSWNPLAEAYTLFHNGEEEEGLGLAHEFVNSITSRVKDEKSPSWAMAARQLLDGLVELMIRGAKDVRECSPGSLSALLAQVKGAEGNGNIGNFGIGNTRSFIDFVNELPEGCSIKNNLFSPVNMAASATTTLAGILDNAYASIAAFTTSRTLLSLTSSTSFDLHQMARADEKHAIFLIIPDEDTTNHFLVTSFIKQLYTTMVQESYSLEGGALPRRLNFVLDEFANLPYISDMPQMITAARSRNMRFFLVVQSDNQLQATYGKDAETIKTNCLNWVYLSSKEDQLIQQIQRMVGVRGNGSNEPLISYQELSAMRKVTGANAGADALILMHRVRPYVSFLPDISRYTQFAEFEKVPLPELTSEFVVFNLPERALSLSAREAAKVYAGVSTEEASGQDHPIVDDDDDDEEEEPEEKPTLVAEEEKPLELEPDPSDLEEWENLLTKLRDDPDGE